ncbi:hypothetical protein L3C95_17180 [Chitinophaga filiformis]|uniref:hypothetical protein n=1 Tax=Chitinophaga filiformis TaxID=104663 RepID=UPI001F3E106D|nr:hypothetical protein [Chitinophaga filiformis]MCF6404633.1 hypothetical protein [Chitinophaga filiformis]
MANSRDKKDQGGGNPGNLTGEGSGQQTSGKRGEKMKKPNKGYHRSSTEKAQQGRHGGNR